MAAVAATTRARDTSRQGDGGGAGRPALRAWRSLAMLAAVAFGTVAVYLSAYPPSDLQPVGWDVHAYTWQIKAIGVTPLAEIGLRPGFPLLGSILGTIARIPPAQDVVVLPPVLAVAMGLAAAAAVRTALRLPVWAAAVIAVVVATWAGVARLVAGYEGTLLSMVLLAAATAALIHARGRVSTIAAAAALLLAACLSHLVFFGIFLGVSGLYVLMSLPSSFGQRRDGVPLWKTDAAAASFAVLGSAALGGGALFTLLGLSPGQSFNVTGVQLRFEGRTRGELKQIRPLATIPAAAVGAAAAARFRLDPSGRALRRLGAAWLLVAGAGVSLGLLGFGVPGNRAMLFALPLPVLVGLALVVLGALVARGGSWLRRVVAGLLVAALVFSLVSLGMLFFFSRVGPTRTLVRQELRASAAYLERLGDQRPAVFVVNERGRWGAFTPKLKLNLLRASMPDAFAARTFVYVGDTSNLAAGRPTLLAADEHWKRNYNATSRAMWQDALPALRGGAVVLIIQRHARQAFAEALRRDPGRLIAPGVYVFRGPVIRVGRLPASATFGLARGLVSAGVLLVLLTVIGWGYAAATLRHARVAAADVACLAPAFGAAVCVLGGFALAAWGGNPKGVAGSLVVAALAAVGAMLALRSRGSLLR